MAFFKDSQVLGALWEKRMKADLFNRVPLRKKGSFGFTLFEILIAIFIFAIVMSTVLGAYDAVFSKVETIEKYATNYRMAENCLHRILLDLQSVYVTEKIAYKPPDMNGPGDPHRFVGDSNADGGNIFSKLRFTAFAHLPFGNKLSGGIAEIIYYVQPADNDTYVLRRSDKLFPYPAFEEKSTDPVLCRRVRSFVIRLYDEEGEPSDSWDSDQDEFKYSTPRSVGIELEFGDASHPYVFETRVALPVYRVKAE
jgi:general secretion pathway protein J